MMPDEEIKMNEELNNLLEEYFPKGHKHRGKAIVIVAQANIEIRKARAEGHEEGVKEEQEKIYCNLRTSIKNLEFFCGSDRRSAWEHLKTALDNCTLGNITFEKLKSGGRE